MTTKKLEDKDFLTIVLKRMTQLSAFTFNDAIMTKDVTNIEIISGNCKH